ncbi:MAG: hypothetical protein IJD16_06235 [Desulfovibrio sp.]|nr:hypothetical protein [Desulfovibrio sp.]
MSALNVLFCTEAAVCFFQAAAAALRTRAYGGHFTGAMFLGLFCGVCAPLLRYGLLGMPDLHVLLQPLALVALTGAMIGALLLVLPAGQRHSEMVFFWLDSAALGLLAARDAVILHDIMHMPAGSALLLALLLAVAPGFVRDAALGDTARFVEEDWYAASAALGAMLALALAACGVALPYSIMGGLLLMLSVRACRRRWGRR